MNLIRVESPCNAVARVNPNFIGKEGQRLVSFLVTLGSHGRVPLLLRVGGAKREDGTKSEDQAGDTETKLSFHNLDGAGPHILLSSFFFNAMKPFAIARSCSSAACRRESGAANSRPSDRPHVPRQPKTSPRREARLMSQEDLLGLTLKTSGTSMKLDCPRTDSSKTEAKGTSRRSFGSTSRRRKSARTRW